LGALLADWDAKLATTPEGQRAHLLDALASKAGIERNRRERQAASSRAGATSALTRHLRE
jgi:hypothetical protein